MARLGDICIQITDGSHNPPMGIEQSNYLMLSSKNIDDDLITFNNPRYLSQEDFEVENKRTNIEPNDLLMTIVGTIGRVAIVPDNLSKICVQRSVAVLKPKSEIVYNRFLMYYLQNMRPYLEQESRGVAQKGIYLKQLSNLIVMLPPLEEQRKIAAVLDKVSDLIAKRRQQLDKLDLLEKARFVEIFCNPIENANWEFVNMADISTDMRTGPFGSALRHNEFVETGIFVLGIDNAVENRFTYNRMRYITEEKYEQLKRYTVRPGDVIITIMGTVGRSAVIPDNIPKAINTKHLACLTINRSKAQPMFVCCAFQMHPEIRQQLTGQAKGAIMDGLNLTIIKKLSFKLPPLEIQNEFVKFFGATEKTKTIIEESLMKLETIKKALMQEYFG